MEIGPRPPLPCSFRARSHLRNGAESAACMLLHQLTNLPPQRCVVARDACEACCRTFAPSAEELNPIVASLLYELTTGVLAEGDGAACTPAVAALLQTRAERNLALSPGAISVLPPPHLWAERAKANAVQCDVVLCCADSSAAADRAVQSVLQQDNVEVFLHLVDDGGGGGALLDRYHHRDHVLGHRQETRRGLFATLHDLLPHLKSEFVAVQDPNTISRSFRIWFALGLLRRHGADLLATALETPAGLIRPETPSAVYRRCLPPQTLVFRRAALIDMGGMAEYGSDADAEIVHRAAAEGRRILISDEPSVVSPVPWHLGSIGAAPRYTPHEGSLRHHGRGFPMQSIACDVVLPFHGHFDYVREAMQSLLDQERAEAIIHLVDDASPGDGAQVLRYWRSHPRVRTYRNARNLGQFTSFNNVIPYLETNLVAVQDADDVSMPQRLCWSGNLLRLADAEIFGGRSRLFGDPRVIQLAAHEHGAACYRASRYLGNPRHYFLENPTLMVRADAFRSLEGFTDFGDTYRNRCGVDTEFGLRAWYSGRRFALSREVVIAYRCHPASATQNNITGFGTAPRTWTELECQRRLALFRRGSFDPQAFGGLRNGWGLTRRL